MFAYFVFLHVELVLRILMHVVFRMGLLLLHVLREINNDSFVKNEW
jgi:hypothetical protein